MGEIVHIMHQNNTFYRTIVAYALCNSSVYYIIIQWMYNLKLEFNANSVPSHIEGRCRSHRWFLTISHRRRCLNEAITMCTFSWRCGNDAYALGIFIALTVSSNLNIFSFSDDNRTRMRVDSERWFGRCRRFDGFWRFSAMTSTKLLSFAIFRLRLFAWKLWWSFTRVSRTNNRNFKFPIFQEQCAQHT